MKQFTLDLARDSQRPIIKLKDWNNFRALLDTGASIPLWTTSESVLKNLDGKLKKQGVPFSGFGGTATGNLYQVTLEVGDLIFPNMHIVACSALKNVPYQLILSATMFNDLIYEIDDKNHKLNVTIPDGESNVRNLVISDNNGKLHVLCTGAEQELTKSDCF